MQKNDQMDVLGIEPKTFCSFRGTISAKQTRYHCATRSILNHIRKVY